ncbi:GatB/YqeY domain-containing protein [SAR202 cluster bacterium AC-409-J13_OGT_754m]|nr:GatB/YqeY domain-containing protein [SAR202 cluster bacterium AC-409-J13_OGT_754m]
MSIEERLKNDLYQAMREKDKIKVMVVRSIISAIGYRVIDKREPLTDSEVMDVISKQVKQRKESIEIYGKANRNDLMEKESAELEILQIYTPSQLSIAELDKLIGRTIDESGASGMNDKGKIMGLIMPQVKGRADGSVINDIVTKILGAMNA